MSETAVDWFFTTLNVACKDVSAPFPNNNTYSPGLKIIVSLTLFNWLSVGRYVSFNSATVGSSGFVVSWLLFSHAR